MVCGTFSRTCARIFLNTAGNRYGKQNAVYHINYDNPKAQAVALRNIPDNINVVGAENLDLKGRHAR
jgi:hypothetical protein